MPKATCIREVGSARFARGVKRWLERYEPPMTTRRRNLLVLGAIILAAAAGLVVFRPKGHPTVAADAIPDGAFLLVTLDLDRLRASPLGPDIAALRQVGEVSTTCGFDPLAHVRSLAVGVPEKPDRVFGVALMTHDLSEEDLVGCAQRVMSARSATAHVVRHGAWTEIEQQGLLAEATRPRIGYREGMPVLVARADYLGDMQAAVDGDRIRAGATPDHAALRKAALEHSGDALLVATAILPKAVRERIAGEVTTSAQAGAMPAVLAVSTVAAAVSVHGQDVEVFAELGCESDAAAGELRALIERKTKALPLSLYVETHGSRLDATLHVPAGQLLHLVQEAVPP